MHYIQIRQCALRWLRVASPELGDFFFFVGISLVCQRLSPSRESCKGGSIPLPIVISYVGVLIDNGRTLLRDVNNMLKA